MNSSDGKSEVTGILLFICAVILALFFYLPADFTGFVGLFFKSIGFGLLGVSAHVIPFFLAYVAIENFLEKRKYVTEHRVLSVIILMILFSSILASITMDFEYFNSLCLNDSGTKASAFKAFQLLWKSGADGVLITKPESTLNVIPGGLLGGLLATSIYTVCGRIVTCILLIGYTFALIVRIFQISVKKTAKAFGKATKNSINRYKNEYENRGKASEYTKSFIPDEVYRNNNQRPTQPVIPSNASPNQNNSNVIYSNPQIVEVPILDGNPIPEIKEDPFNAHSMPVDVNGFIDITGNNDNVTDSSVINYGEKTVFVDNSQNTADFSYSARHKNPDYQVPEPSKMYDFKKDSNSNQKDFYDLTENNSNETVINQEESSYEVYDDNQQDYGEPIEIIDNGYVEPQLDEYQNRAPGVRTPNVPVNLDLGNHFDYGVNNYSNVQNNTNITPTVEVAPVVNPVAPVVATPATTPSVVSNTESLNTDTVDSSAVIPPTTIRNDIKINDPDSFTTISNTEGRSMDMSSNVANENVATEPNVPASQPTRRRVAFRPAPTNLLSGDVPRKNANNDTALKIKATKLEEALKSFGIEAKVINITYGPAITRFELTLKTGIKVSRVLSLTDDIQLAMAAVSVRIEAPIPGKSAIGIEIPNDTTTAVHLRNLLETPEFRSSSPLTVALGRDIPNRPILCDLAKMPHLLVAGSTGSGKSVCINSILLSILCKETPDNVRMILIDPKQVELSIYNGIPHLITPVVTDPKKATNALKWAVKEMNDRYAKFAENHVRNMDGYNEKAKTDPSLQKMPLILLVIDEFADIMTVAAKEVEEQVMRLAAMARAAGIHMILATQRPSVDVITGVLKNNMPSRIAFAVTSGVDSRTILDSVGAEKLLGKGDMLYAPQSSPKPIRGQGAFVPDSEVEKVIEHLRKQGTYYDDNVNSFINNVSTESSSGGASSGGASAGDGSADDDLLDQAVEIVIDAKVASVSILQRKLGIGYPRAARLIDVMEQNHYIGPFEGSKPRKVLITKTDWLEIKAKKQS